MIHLVTEYLEDTAVRFPDKVAFVDDAREITFRALRREALQVAHRLQEVTEGTQQFPVLVYLEKSISCVAAFLGTAYAGGFYSPVDTKMPAARIGKIVQTLRPRIVLTDRAHREDAEAFAGTAAILAYEDFLEETPWSEDAVAASLSRMTDTDILYVLFTSGSTGTPKGVIINHRAVIDYVEWITATYHLDGATVFANQAQFYFDVSVQDIFGTLRNGSKTLLIKNRMFVAPARVWKWMFEHQVNTIEWVPSMLSLMANFDILGHMALPPLKNIFFAGEVMPMKQLNYWRRYYPDAVFANLYGPTECTVICAYYTLDREFSDDDVLPMGRACENCEAIVLGAEDRRITNPGTIGELCIRGTCLSMGYYGDAEKTAEAFVQNPLQANYPEKIYRTGDIVKYNERGELVYVSRKDFQIKHRGYRIELGEIDAAATAVEGVDYACCLFDAARDRLILAYTGEATEDDVRRALAGRLQEYMIPAEIHRRAAMLFNLNGKIDRKALTEEYCARGVDESDV